MIDKLPNYKVRPEEWDYEVKRFLIEGSYMDAHEVIRTDLEGLIAYLDELEIDGTNTPTTESDKKRADMMRGFVLKDILDMLDVKEESSPDINLE